MADSPLQAIPGFTPVRGIAVDRAGALIEAREDGSGRRVVIRVLSPALTADAQLMRRLRSTAQLRTSLRHPNLVSVVAIAERGSAVVYEWVDGVTLADACRNNSGMDTAAAFVLFDDCLRGLEALHQRRLLHRDLRPETLLIDTAGTGRLRDADLPSPPLHAGWRAGTPQFMAPELWHGAEHSVASDLYAATCLFATALQSRPPYTAEDLSLLQRHHDRGNIPGANLAAPVRGLLAEGMAKDPRQRPADTARFRADVEVAAAAYLDDDWRRRGRASLAGMARARLAEPAPASPLAVEEALAVVPPAGGTAWWRSGRLVAAAFVIAFILVVLVVVAASALTAPPSDEATPAPVPVATPTPAPGQSSAASGAPFTTLASPSLSFAATPLQSPTLNVTPNLASSGPSIAPVTTPTASASATPTTTASPTQCLSTPPVC